jgi:hypothetical protein
MGFASMSSSSSSFSFFILCNTRHIYTSYKTVLIPSPQQSST